MDKSQQLQEMMTEMYDHVMSRWGKTYDHDVLYEEYGELKRVAYYLQQNYQPLSYVLTMSDVVNEYPHPLPEVTIEEEDSSTSKEFKF